jgi:DNA polymerase elongation subunit (family B)
MREAQSQLEEALGLVADESSLGIVSVWAEREGRALIWQRQGGQVARTVDRFRPWILATTLDDLAHLGASLAPAAVAGAERALFSYRELAGPEYSYRYLVSARSGRELDRAVCAGASRRLGKSVTSLYDLDCYYRVGPVEQYLMLTGKVYFRGLTYDDLHRLQFDFETTALDPQRGRIFLAAVSDNHGLAVTLEAPAAEDEPRLIADLLALIQERDPDILENHNLFGFDLPFLEARAAAHNIPLMLGRSGGPMLLESYEEPAWRPGMRGRMRYSVAGRELIDTLDAVRRHDFVVRDMPSHRLKDVARYFGLAAEDRVYIEGADVYPTYQRDPEAVRRYALDDVIEVDGISRRLLGAPFALAQMAPRRYERLGSAGPAMGILEPMLVRAYLRVGAAPPYQASRNDAPNAHEGGAVHLFAAGVAEQVVKADVASLYPSLMRTYQIGPACDHLGTLLHVVSRLIDLRLYHKDAARAVARGSPEANYHDALQAAMKLLINSAYGYMGAGSMALFADSYAAGEVTRRGREVLNQVVDALRERGMALIEADTDGVYFAVPQGWSEAQERALVADVGALLPSGIRLEYEGRYRSMFSHEVKNYALLTYSGQLIVRGVAMRSSRSEPFGERFLREALGCVMVGDVVGAVQAYRNTVTKLHRREFIADDLGSRVRLSKSPDEYLRSRTQHPEAQYEALLAAGRAQWSPGERVRFYRRSDKTYVWLPDETADDGLVTDGAEQTVRRADIGQSRDYDVDHYLHVLLTSYAGRLRKAFAPDDFEQLFRTDTQLGLFDTPIEQIEPIWIRCRSDADSSR